MSTTLSDAAPEDEAFAFAPEESLQAEAPASASIRVLSVDDDPTFQRSLGFALDGFKYRDRPIELLHAGSMAQATKMLSLHPNIATIFLDVVMEFDDAGLRLVRAIRETLGNHEVRIVLVTGQPGLAPMRETIDTLDINDYWTKTELTANRLATILATCLRDWEQVTALSRARRGLQMIVESSNQLLYAGSLGDFCARIVEELARLLQVPAEGLVCAQEGHDGGADSLTIVAAAGRYRELNGKPLAALEHAEVVRTLRQCLLERQNLRTPGAQALFMAGPTDGPSCVAYIPAERALDQTELGLLQVFASHANSGLINLALVSRLDQMAYSDPLLGLPNRNALLRKLAAYSHAADAPPHTLLLVDIDDFSRCNLAMGFSEGDEILRHTAALLQHQFPLPAQVARLHDDLFAVFGATEQLATEKVSALHSNPRGTSMSMARVDLADFHGPAQDSLPLATLMLKLAKKRGYGQIEHYHPGLETETARGYALAHALSHAIATETIEIVLQPQVELASGRIIGAEALARWPLPGGGQISPAEFIPLAEANGDIVRLGRLVLRKAARFVADTALPDIRVAVNFSVIQLVQEDIVAEVLAVCAEEGATPTQIEIEVTESVAMQGGRQVLDHLFALKAAGFTIAIDDFGTGFSSLAYLRELPATVLKIDRCFVQEIGCVQDSDAIADMILRLASQLGFSVIAEGVENADQADWLHLRGCDLAQGFYYAPGLAPGAFRAKLDRNFVPQAR